MRQLIPLLALLCGSAVGAAPAPSGATTAAATTADLAPSLARTSSVASPAPLHAQDTTSSAAAAASPLATSISAAAAAAAGATTAAATAAGPLTTPPTTSPEQSLVEWLLGLGSQVRVRVRPTGVAGVRGLVAAGPAVAGEVLASVPLAAAITLGGVNDTAPELAVTLLRERHRTKPRYGPYFDVLPPPPHPPPLPQLAVIRPETPAHAADADTGSQAETAAPCADIAAAATGGGACARAAGVASSSGRRQRQSQTQELSGLGRATSAPPPAAPPPTSGGQAAVRQPACVEEFPEEAVAALAGEDLRLLAGRKRAWMRRVWSGQAPAVRLPLARAVPRRAVSLEEFAWATCMVSSRSISGPGGSMLLIPLIDLANHCPGAAPATDVAAPAAAPAAPAAPGPSELRFRILPDSGAFEATGGGSRSSGGRVGGVGGGRVVVLELVAGRDLAAGEEVCISYGDLRPDEAFLYYGFLPPELSPPPPPPSTPPPSVVAAPPSWASQHTVSPPPPPPRLFAVDEREYNSGARPGKVSYTRLQLGVTPETEVRAELGRMQARRAEVAAEVEAEAREAPAPGVSCGMGGSCGGGHVREQRCPAAVAMKAAAEKGTGLGKSCSCPAAGYLPPADPAAAAGSSSHAPGSSESTPLALVARLNRMRLEALTAEISRLQAVLDAQSETQRQ